MLGKPTRATRCVAYHAARPSNKIHIQKICLVTADKEIVHSIIRETRVPNRYLDRGIKYWKCLVVRDVLQPVYPARFGEIVLCFLSVHRRQRSYSKTSEI
jgi:hypothetical protein